MIRHLENAKEEQGFCLKFVLRSVFEFLPPPRCDRNNQNSFSSLTNLIRQRHQNLVEFLVSSKKSKDSFTPQKERKTAKRVTSTEKVLLNKSFRETRQALMSVLTTYRCRRRQRVFEHKSQMTPKIMTRGTLKLHEVNPTEICLTFNITCRYESKSC